MLAVAAGAMALFFVAATGWQHIERAETSRPLYQRIARAKNESPSIYADGCDDWYRRARLKVCSAGASDSTTTVVAIGDSIGLQWFPAFEQLAQANGWHLLVMTKSACPIVERPIYYARIHAIYDVCARWRRTAIARIEAIRPDAVIMGSSSTYSFSRSEWRTGTREVVSRLSKAASRVYVLRSTPLLPFDGPDCLAPRSRIYHLFKSSDCAAKATEGRFDDVFRSIRAATADLANVSLVDMTPDVCPAGVCLAERDGRIVFRDKEHLTVRYVRSIAAKLGRHLASSAPPA